MELSAITKHDAPDLAAIFHSIGMQATVDLAMAAGWIRHMNSAKAIGRKLAIDGVMAGGGQLTIQKRPHAVELGVWLRADMQGRGYGKAVTRLFVELALGPLGYHRAFGRTSSRNLRMQRCLELAGMVREGVLRHVGFADGAYIDELYFGRLSSDGGNTQSAS